MNAHIQVVSPSDLEYLSHVQSCEVTPLCLQPFKQFRVRPESIERLHFNEKLLMRIQPDLEVLSIIAVPPSWILFSLFYPSRFC